MLLVGRALRNQRRLPGALAQVSWNSRNYATEPPVMAVVRQELKQAMKSGDSVGKDAIRAVMSAVKNANIDKPDSINSDIKFHGLVSSLIGKRNKAIAEYTSGNRPDLVEKEQALVNVLEKILAHVEVAKPEEIDAKVSKIIEDLGVAGSDKSAMGKIMSKIDFKQVESEWRTSQRFVAESIKRVLGQRKFSTYSRVLSHENPLGIPRSKPLRRQISRRPIPGVKKVVAVSSAKGGVGKSTVAVNIACSLFNQGLNVGILDVDIFGPSIPLLLNLSGEPGVGEDNHLIPKENYGLKAMSMGFLVDPNKAVAWRGLLVQKALEQLMFEVNWGNNLDVLVLDMPPGTGDVQLTLAQQIQVDGAVIVSTPQDMALVDVVRGVDMFKKVNTTVLGVVQNMSYFVCPNCNHESHIFGDDGAAKMAEKQGVEFLGSVPLTMDIRVASDNGKPITVSDPDGQLAQPYKDISLKIMEKLGLQSK